MTTQRCWLVLFVTNVFVASATGDTILLPGGRQTQWRYYEQDAQPDDRWNRSNFDDSQWKQGNAPLGYGERGLGTSVSFGGKPAQKRISYYFRTTFKVTQATLDQLEWLGLFIRRDDGAVIYVNGKEVARTNMPTGAIGHDTLAAVAIGGPTEQQTIRFLIKAKEVLVVGSNTIAVEVHQAAPASSDLYLDLMVRGYSAEETPREDKHRAGLIALQEGDFARAIELLRQTDPGHPLYAETMALIGYQVYSVRLAQPMEGLPFVKKAYEANPTSRNVVRAYIKTHVLSGVLFDDDKLDRERPARVEDAYQFLISFPKIEDNSPKLMREQMEADLDYLEHILVNCFAYLELQDVDYRAALDAIRVSLPDELPVHSFEICLAKLISLFGDSHASVGDSAETYLPVGYAPFHAAEADGRVFLFVANVLGRQLLDEEHPYVTHIDGRPISDWLEVAGYTIVKQAPQWHRRHALQMLRFITYLRAELGLPNNEMIQVTLESEDKQNTVEKQIKRSSRLDSLGTLRRRSRRIDDIGYLVIPRMTSDPSFIADLEQWMEKFRDTEGLVIDLRGNSGGTKSILFSLFPYFVSPDAPLHFVELSTYRKPMELSQPTPQGFMMSNMSAQPITSSRWTTDAERKQVADLIANFKPAWNIPLDKFSQWHVLGLDSKTNPRCYHYDKPLVILHDSGTFSSGDIFLGAFENHPQATLMGTPSGGGNGWMEPYRLPNSKITVVLCQSAKFRPDGKPYDTLGIDPDIRIDPTRDDLLGKSDTLLEAALKTLQQQAVPE